MKYHKHAYHILIFVLKWTELETKDLSAQGINAEIFMQIFFGTLMVKWTKNRNF